MAFADFWLADQLNSLVVAILDMEYLSCFYALDYYSVQGKQLIPIRPSRTVGVFFVRHFSPLRTFFFPFCFVVVVVVCLFVRLICLPLQRSNKKV